MERMQTDELIRVTARRLFAKHGYDGVSMRVLSRESGVGSSSIYHFFKDKDVLLRHIYDLTNRNLGIARSHLPTKTRIDETLGQLIHFQFDHIEEVVYVLKYYLTFRDDFASLRTKTLPAKSVLHIEEVVRKGIDAGVFAVAESEIVSKAKVVAHTINGYLLEYYPDVPDKKERQEIVNDIVAFSMAGLTK
jgi:AcrR family transcriptional regulator